MMIKQTLATLLLISSSIALAGTAVNAPQNYNRHTGFYAGANIGPGIVNHANIFSNTSTTTFEGFGWAVYAGYHFIPYLALEAGFLQNYMTLHDMANNSVNGTVNVPYLAARADIPLGSRFSVFGKLGYTYYHQTVSDRDYSSGSATFVAAGLGYAVTHEWTITTQYEASLGVFDSIAAITVGAEYNFS